MKRSAHAPPKIIASAKKLLASGRVHEAHNLLLDEGYVNRLQTKIQQAFLTLIPIDPTLKAMLDGVYQDLADPRPDVRFKALTQLAREFAREHLRDKVRWMRDPRASEPIIKAALDSNRKIYDRALIVLLRLTCKYFPDQRSLPAFLLRLTDREQETRIRAIGGIGCLRREELLVHLIDFIDHGTDLERAEVSGQIWGLSIEAWENMNLHPIQWTDVGRRFWENKMVVALRDSCADVRKNAVRALKGLGTPDTLAALQAARSVEHDEEVCFYLDEAIAAIKERAG
jgi:HEAT repeat protein